LVYNEFEKYDFRLKGESEDNVSFELGRWRFQQKFTNKCEAIFVTVAVQFLQLLDILDRSGHATTEEAVFYIFNAGSSVVNGFKNYIYTNISQKQLPDVTAAVVLVNQQSYALYCHFCPQDSKLAKVSHSLKQIVLQHSQIQSSHTSNNENEGYYYILCPCKL